MNREEAKQFLERRSEQCVQLGSFVLQRIPVLGSHVQHFFDQDSLLIRLLHHEGVKHLEQVTAELEVAKVCGPEQEAAELRRKAALLSAEVFHEPEIGADVQPLVPKTTEE